ncbi:MAG: 30S ribosomal protein S8 [Candidatus Pacebacteria bacterium CG10_big_fil_rev_8_21_14_0_10_42_12]|nr:30S ribosomal protein S8 [Candidatus Paceibacterota bacterium]PIR62941.1 MAG: 30S ribosomal protein S8 [Candidatus Pacebacteria bacterium CG10_big_fil_rev_8_21_14_0_10_42_12]
MTDPIADLLIRIKNALWARHTELEVPYSRLKHSLADILVAEGYLEKVSIDKTGQFPVLHLVLKYIGRIPAVNDVKRLSKPGRRVYAPANKIPQALGGYGITILSTNQGLLTQREARKRNVGGELLCQVW